MVALMTFIVTQVLLPAFNGHKLFPLFRSKLRKAEANLVDRKTTKEVKAMEATAIRLELENEQVVHDVLDEIIDDPERKRINK
jgi:hypothetical protein